MSIVASLLGVVAAPIVEGYSEYRKWQLAEQALTSLSNSIGNRVDQTIGSAGQLASRSYIRLENGISSWLNDSGEYLKLFAACGSFQLISGAAKITSLAGGCFLHHTMSCSIIDLAGSTCSAYSVLAASVLAYKLGIDFYRFWKSNQPPSATHQINNAQSTISNSIPLGNQSVTELLPALQQQIRQEDLPETQTESELPGLPENLENLTEEMFDSACLTLFQKLDANRNCRNQMHSRAETSRKLLKQKV